MNSLSGGEIRSIIPEFIISAFHLICAGILGLGGIYHAIFGPERLEETTYGFVFGYRQDRFRITAIISLDVEHSCYLLKLFI